MFQLSCGFIVVDSVSSRLDIQAELKEQNQHLIAANELLQKNLTDSQVHNFTPDLPPFFNSGLHHKAVVT